MTQQGVLLVIDQHPLADALEDKLRAHPGFRLVVLDLNEIEGADPAMASVEHSADPDASPEAAIIEIADAEVDRLAGPLRLREVWPKLRILVLAPRPELPLLREAARSSVNALADIRTPVDGILGLLSCIQSDLFVVEGDTAVSVADRARSSLRPSAPDRGPQLTPREREVLELLGRGYDTTSIAERLGLSVHTARGHVKRVMRKLRARSQLQAVLNASELGLLPRLEHVRHDPQGGW